MPEEPASPKPKARLKPRVGGAAAGPAAKAATTPPKPAPRTRSPRTSPPAPALSSPPASPEPTPLEVPLEEQITDLPLLEFPGHPNQEFIQWAADKRRSRLQVEVIGAAMLILVGVGASVVTGRAAFIMIAIFAVAGLAAYEFLVSSFE